MKEAVFPFARFPGVDTVLGPEMKSTGEVMGIARASISPSPSRSSAAAPGGGPAPCVSVRNSDKPRIVEALKMLVALGFRVIATSGTKRYLDQQGVPSVKINKVLEGRPHIVDAIKNGEVQLVFNTTDGAQALANPGRFGPQPSCIKCRTTPLFQVPSRRREELKPSLRGISRSAHCKAISAAGTEDRPACW